MSLTNLPIIQKIIAFFISILAMLGINIGGNEETTEKTTPVITIVNEAEEHSLEVALKGNITTGYDWYAEIEVDGDCTGKVISSVSDKYVTDNHDEGVVGAGGTHYFTFKAESEGQARITFTYLRPFEDSLPAETVVVDVTVDGSLDISAAEEVLK